MALAVCISFILASCATPQERDDARSDGPNLATITAVDEPTLVSNTQITVTAVTLEGSNVVVGLVVENASDSVNIFVNTNLRAYVDGESVNLSSVRDNSLNHGELSPGRRTTGSVFFTAPEGAQEFEIVMPMAHTNYTVTLLFDVPSEGTAANGEDGNNNATLGTRANPFRLNQTAIYDEMDITQSFLSYFAFKAELTATEVIRGYEASALFANNPEEGKEFFLVRLRINVLESVFDEIVSLNNARFGLISGEGVRYDQLVSASGIELLDDVFAGAQTEGYIFGIINAGDRPLIVFGEARDGGIWFDVNE